ncbi:MAG: hypothetical protein Q9173_002339 [Seirophora scorigena]
MTTHEKQNLVSSTSPFSHPKTSPKQRSTLSKSKDSAMMDSNIMFATKKDVDAWNKDRSEAKHAIGAVRLSTVRFPETCAALLPSIQHHWAIANSPHSGASDGLLALTILEDFHNRITVPKSARRLAPPLHCRYLHIVFVQQEDSDGKTSIPHAVFHEVVGVLGSFLGPCRALKVVSKHYGYLDLTSVVLHLETLLGEFLAQIVAATNIPAKEKYKDKKASSDPLQDAVKRRRRDLVEKLRNIEYCLQERILPSRQGDVASVAAENPVPAKFKDGVYQKLPYGEWGFRFAPEKGCKGCS